MISVFLPAYNEENRIKDSVTRVEDFLSKKDYEFEIVVVDDGSEDNTAKKVREFDKENIRCLRYNFGPTRRENLGLSFHEAKGDLIAFMDSDIPVPISYLGEIIDSLREGYDIAIGSRYKGLKPKRKADRLLISKAYNFFLKILFLSKIKDHQCGLKGFRKKAILKLLDEMQYDNNLRRGWFWDAEILIRAQRKNLSIKEIPVEWTYDEKTSFDITWETKMLPYVLKTIFKTI